MTVENLTTSHPSYAIEVENLSKTYKATKNQAPHHALKNVSLQIPKGSLFGLLGPNGAGKSTLINILAGLVIKSSGTAKIWGIDIDDDATTARSKIGVVPQELNLDPFFTPKTLLDLQAGLFGVPKNMRRTTQLLNDLALADKANSYARTLSGGMQRRLLVAKALVHTPPVLVLDEPTAGVDLQLRQHLWQYVKELHRKGTTILLTTHYLEEAEALCDTIAIIDQGKVVACQPTHELIHQFEEKKLIITFDQDIMVLPDSLQSLNATLEYQRWVFSYQPHKMGVAEIISKINDAGLIIRDLETQQSDLEDAFLKLTYQARQS